MQIQTAGGLSIELPTITIAACHNFPINFQQTLNQITQIIFISKNAVRYFFAGLTSAKLNLPDNIIITCIGPGTAELLTNYKMYATYIPQINTSEHLLELANFAKVLNEKILLVKGVGGRATISNELQARGANLTIIDVYERKLPKTDPEIVNAIWQEDAIDIIIYTSKQAMLNAIEIFPSAAKEWLLTKPCVVISQRLAEHAENLGFKKIIQTTYANIIVAIEGQTK